MFEKVVESILVEYVSEWVEGLDAEKMKIALFGGKVEVRELKLKTAALDKFQLPLRVKAGTLGRLALKVPWKRLTKEAVKLVVDDVFLMVVPAHQDEMQKLKEKVTDDAPDSYALRMRFAKQQEIRVRELFEKSKNEDTRRVSDADDSALPGNSGDTTSGWGYREKILHNILDNVSVEIKNIHIRYEDTSQMLSKNPFAVGATVEAITVNTTNANGHVTFVDRAQSHTPFVHKILEVKQVGLYCDDTAHVQELVSSRRHSPPAEAYIIRPFNISAKMTVNHDDTTLFSIPRLQFVADIGSIFASVTEGQCNDVISAINFVSTHEIYLKRIHIRKKRPKIPIRRDAKSWWMYALYGVQVLYGLESKRHGDGNNRMMSLKTKTTKCTWKLFGERWMQRKQYIDLHKKLLRAAAKKHPPETIIAERTQLMELEDLLDVETIVFFRLCAEKEFDLEESRHDSVKKLSWKSRWKSNSTEGAPSLLRRLDPLERFALYSTIGDQLKASTTAMAAKQQEEAASQAIVYALDLAVTSFTFSLVEPAPRGTGLKEFLRFELDQFVFAIFQRSRACTISSSIRSIQMLDFNESTINGKGDIVPQPLFYALTPNIVRPVDVAVAVDTKDRDHSTQLKFIDLSIESSEAKLKFTCALQPFRYIHHLAVASRLQSYFVIQVEVAPELRENAEEAIASSSTWLNNAIFSKPSPEAVRAVEKQKQDSKTKEPKTVSRVVELSVLFPVVDVFVLSSDTSPILQAKLSDVNFKSNNLVESFEFGIDGVEITFIDGDVNDTRHSTEDMKHGTNSKPITPRTSSYYDLRDRKRSTILRKTRIVFSGEQVNDAGRGPRWSMKCTAPPIYFTLSSAQYHQVVEASAAWAASASADRKPAILVRQSAAANVVSKSAPNVSSTQPPEFDPSDEKFSLCVHIPQILVVLEGGGGMPAEVTESGDLSQRESGSEVDLVLDIRLINVEAKFSSVSQAILADFRRLSFFKRKADRSVRRDDSHGKKVKLTTAEAIAQVNSSGPSSRTSSLNDDPEEPDPAFHPESGAPTTKLIEIGQKVTFVTTCMDPLQGRVKIQQLVVYWDHDLLITLFRSYLWGNSVVAKSSLSSGFSSRTSSGSSSSSSPAASDFDTTAVVADVHEEKSAPFCLEIHVDKWFVFMRPQNTVSARFSLKLYGRDMMCNISTISSSYTCVSLNAKNGLYLESSRFVTLDGNSAGDDVCELLRTQHSVKINIETAGYGVLTHRTGAATYVDVRASNVEVNYVNAHIVVLFDHLLKQIIGFFNWVSVQLRPPHIKTVSSRTKLDVSAENIKMLLPRGPVGNAIERERRPERLELDVQRLVISSRQYPSDPRVEQLLIRADTVQLASFLAETTRQHTDAVGSVDEAVSRAAEQVARQKEQHKNALSKTVILAHDSIFVDHVSVPILTMSKKRQHGAEGSNVAARTQMVRRPLDLEDVAKEMENFCGSVRVFLARPHDWENEGGSTKARLAIQVGTRIALAIDKDQIELLACIFDENFGRAELLPPPLGTHVKQADDEKQVLDVQIGIGDVSLSLLRHPNPPPGQPRRRIEGTESVTDRVIGRIDLEDIKVSVSGYASGRGQQHIVASNARFWKIDTLRRETEKTRDGASSQIDHQEVECGELHFGSENAEDDHDTSQQCIDVTIDQHAQVAPGEGPPIVQPLEIRIHIFACALLPPFVPLITRLLPFFSIDPNFPGYEKKRGGPVSVSVTTGDVHFMLAQHDTRPDVHSDTNSSTPLNLVLSGCVVVRYTDVEASLKRIQLFGRKMALELSSKWPPLSEEKRAQSVPPSPCATPTYAKTPRQAARSMSTSGSGHYPPVSLENYHRALCDDFTFDLEIADTAHVDNTLKISATLTHVHAVLCTFDIMMLSKLQALIESVSRDHAASGAVSRTSSRTRSQMQQKEAPEVSKTTSATTSSSQDGTAGANIVVVNTMIEDVSLTFVREIGEYFSPLARVYSYCLLSKVVVTTPLQTAQDKNPGLTQQVVEVSVYFNEESDSELREDEGLSAWAFNAILGSWEPIIEPWTFNFGLRLENHPDGKASTQIDINGSQAHSLNANFSPRLLDNFCAIAKEVDPLSHPSGCSLRAATASVISCGFYLANDTGVNVTYWVTDHTNTSTHSRGFTYAPRSKRVPEVLLPRHKIPLKLSTAIFPSLPNDQTLSFSWGDEDWHPLTDVRIHSAGKYVYSVLPKAGSRTASHSSSSAISAIDQPKLLLALFDISAIFGYRTLTVSSLIRVFNEADVPISCGVLGDDGRTVTEIGVIDPQSACGVPITMIRSITSIRLLIRPHRPEGDAVLPSEPSGTVGSVLPPAVGTEEHSEKPVWEKEHRWSNELLISDKEENTEGIAACSLVLDDYDCRCQRMFDGSQPLHLSQICRSNGSFFRVWTRVFTASNGSNLKYAQLRVFPTLTFENKCGVPIFVIAFVFKKMRRAGISQDREYSHIVASEKIPPHGSMQFLSSSLQETTYCSISMTGFSWSKLFVLPSVFNPAVGPSTAGSTGSADVNRAASSLSSMMGGGIPATPPSPSSQRGNAPNNEVLCLLEDFRSRKASINVTFHGATPESALRRVVIQPKYLIRNETTLSLTFEPSVKAKPKLPTAKTFFSLPSSSPSSKQPSTCCGSPQLEMIHTKLNALHGATTTAATPSPSAVSSGKKTRTPSSPSRSDVDVSQVPGTEYADHFYCSETNLITIQVEGNAQLTSGVQQFHLDAAVGGTNSTIRLFDESTHEWHDIVVILEQIDAFTTKATFVERYVFWNRTDLNLLVVPACELTGASSQEPSNGLLLKPLSSTPYNWSYRSSLPIDPSIRVKVSDPSVTGWRWSGRFSLHDVSECALKLSNKYTSQVLVVRVEVRVESSVRVFVVISSEDNASFPLYRVINSTAHEIIHFKQSFEGGSGELSEQSAVTLDYNRGVTQRLFPGESLCFGWDEGFFQQSLERVLEISYTSDSVHTKVLLDQPGEAQRVDLPETKSKPASSVYVHWYLNGVTKTVQVHDTQLPRDKLTGKLNVDATQSSLTKRITSVVSEISFHLTMPNMMLSILNSVPEEVLLFTAKSFDFRYACSRDQHDEIEVKIGSFQLDNQLSNAVFPVVFTPTPLNPSSFNLLESPTKKGFTGQGTAGKKLEQGTDDAVEPSDTFFHLSIFRLSYGDDVDYLKYLSAMVQPARLQVDDFLIISVALLSSDCLHIIHRYYPPQNSRKTTVSGEVGAANREKEQSPELATNSGDVSVDREMVGDHAARRRIPRSERRMYIETLELHPFKIQVTFQQNNLSKAPLFDDGQSNFLLPVVFMILKSNLVNIDSASINLNALHIYHSFTTRSFMASAIQQHYAFQGVLQMYSLLGSADILGNPLGLVKNLGTGVKDFFYEPMAGMVKSPQEFVMGLSRGTASLVKNSVYGTFNAASKFTGTLSSGIAALSMDGDYIKARNTRNRQEVATHIGTGLFYGTKQLGQGILAGVSGVITAPALGAYNNGLTGFMEGVGKGLIGVAVKPTAGILDLAAKTTAGITATATVFDKKARDTRMRLPRMMHTSDKRLRVYSNDEAMISQLLHRLPHKLLRNEHYEAHVFLPLSRAIVATSHQFFHVDYSSIAGVAPAHPRITWKFPLSSVWGAQKSAKGVSIFIGASTNVSLTSTSSISSAPSSPAQSSHIHLPAMVTKSSMTTVLVPLKETESAIMERLVKCVSDLVAKQRERAPVTESFSSPLPRNSIGMVLEPVRDSNKVPGYEGYGGRVVDVFIGSACFRAGVEVGDIIVGFGKQKFESGDHGSALRTQLSMMRKGDTLELMVLRHGEIKYISVITE